MEKTLPEIPEHVFAVVVFIDPTYSSGWTERSELPNANDVIHVGAGVLVEEDEKGITLALMTGLFDSDKTGDVLNPLRIHRSGILLMDKFTWRDYNEVRRRNKKIQKCINQKISDFC